MSAMVRIFLFGERWNVPINSAKWFRKNLQQKCEFSIVMFGNFDLLLQHHHFLRQT